MKIVVTTPTGNIGSRVVQLLIQAGIRPTVLARKPERLSSAVIAASDVLQGDLTDQDFVLESTRDADALFWLIPSDYDSDDMLGDIARLGEQAAQAIQKNRIGRTVFLSSGGAERRDETLIGALGKVEDRLNETGANILHLRPDYLFTNLFMNLEEIRQGILVTTVPLDKATGWNDPRDVGDIAATWLLNSQWTGQRIQAIHGPEDLTFADVARILGEAVGREVQALQVSEEEARTAMLDAGMRGPGVDELLALSRSVAAGDEPDPGRGFVSTTPTTLGAWCYANLRPALQN
ncbi:NAD-dependent epimerase/dehydratase family protein [bacterium]|nr:MAG: NAD-dependent epimerase/dehydratase family protein [bacterium]